MSINILIAVLAIIPFIIIFFYEKRYKNIKNDNKTILTPYKKNKAKRESYNNVTYLTDSYFNDVTSRLIEDQEEE